MARQEQPRNRPSGSPKASPSAKDWLHFVQLDPFAGAWKRLGLGDDDLRLLELAIMAYPEAAPVVAGTGGVRKMRFAPARWATGKRGACRVYYAYFPEHGIVTLVYAHSKSESETITAEQAHALKTLIDDIGRALDKRRRTRNRKDGT